MAVGKPVKNIDDIGARVLPPEETWTIEEGTPFFDDRFLVETAAQLVVSSFQVRIARGEPPPRSLQRSNKTRMSKVHAIVNNENEAPPEDQPAAAPPNQESPETAPEPAKVKPQRAAQSVTIQAAVCHAHSYLGAERLSLEMVPRCQTVKEQLYQTVAPMCSDSKSAPSVHAANIRYEVNRFLRARLVSIDLGELLEYDIGEKELWHRLEAPSDTSDDDDDSDEDGEVSPQAPARPSANSSRSSRFGSSSLGKGSLPGANSESASRQLFRTSLKGRMAFSSAAALPLPLPPGHCESFGKSDIPVKEDSQSKAVCHQSRCRRLQQDPDHETELLTRNFEARFWRALANGLGRSLFGQTSHRLVLRFEACAQDIFDRYEGELQLAVNSLMGWLPSWVSDSLFLSFSGLRAIVASQQTSRKYIMLHRCLRTLMQSSGRYIFVATPSWYLPIVSSLPGLGRREEVRRSFSHISLGLRPVWPTCCLGPEACIRVVDQLWGGMIKGQRAALELCAGIQPLGPWVLRETLASESLLAEALRVIEQVAPLLEEAYMDMINRGVFAVEDRPPVDSLAAKAFALDLVPQLTLIARQLHREKVALAKGPRTLRRVGVSDRLQSTRLSVLEDLQGPSGPTAATGAKAGAAGGRRPANSSSLSSAAGDIGLGSGGGGGGGGGGGAKEGEAANTFVVATTTNKSTIAEGDLGDGMQEDLIRNGIFAPARRRHPSTTDPSVVAEAGSLLAGLHHDNRGLAAVSSTKTGGARVREVIFAGRKPRVLTEDGSPTTNQDDDDDSEELMCWPLGAGLAPGRIPIHDSPDLLPTAPPPNCDPMKEEELRESLAQAKRHLRHGWTRAELVRALGLGPSPPNLVEDSIVAATDTQHRRRARSEIRLREDPDDKVPTEKLSLSERWQLLQRQPSARPGQTAAASRRTKSAPAAFRTQEWDVGDPHQNSAVALALQQEITRCLRAMSTESPLHLAWRRPRNSGDLMHLYSRRLSLGVMLLFSALRSPLPASADAPLLHFLSEGLFQEPSLDATSAADTRAGRGPGSAPGLGAAASASPGSSPPGSASWAMGHAGGGGGGTMSDGFDGSLAMGNTNGSLANSHGNTNGSSRPMGNANDMSGSLRNSNTANLDSSSNSNFQGSFPGEAGPGAVAGAGTTGGGASGFGGASGLGGSGGQSASGGRGPGGAGAGGATTRRISLADGVYALGCLPIFATLPSETSAAASPTMAGYFRIGIPHAMLAPEVLRDILVSVPSGREEEEQEDKEQNKDDPSRQEGPPSGPSVPSWREGSLLMLLTTAAAEELWDPQAWYQEMSWMSSERCGFASLCCVFRFILALEHLLIWNATQEVSAKPPLGDFFPFIRECGSQVEQSMVFVDMSADEGKTPLLVGPPIAEGDAPESPEPEVLEAEVSLGGPPSRPGSRQSMRLRDFASWVSRLSPGRVVYSSHQEGTGDLYWRLDSVVVVFVFAYMAGNGVGLDCSDIARVYSEAVGRTSWWEPCKVSLIILASKLSAKFETCLERSRCFRVGPGEELPSYDNFQVEDGSEILICHENCLGALMGGANEALSTHQRLFENEAKSFTASPVKSRNKSQTFGRVSAVGAARNAVRDWRAQRPKHPRQIVLDLHADLFRQLLAHSYTHTKALLHLSRTNYADDPFASVQMHDKGSGGFADDDDDEEDEDNDEEGEEAEADLVKPGLESPRRSVIQTAPNSRLSLQSRGSQGSSRGSLPNMFGEGAQDQTPGPKASTFLSRTGLGTDKAPAPTTAAKPAVSPATIAPARTGSDEACLGQSDSSGDESAVDPAGRNAAKDPEETPLSSGTAPIGGNIARVDPRVPSPTRSSKHRTSWRKRALHPKHRSQEVHEKFRSSPNLDVNTIDFLGLGDWSRLDPLSSWSRVKPTVA